MGFKPIELIINHHIIIPVLKFRKKLEVTSDNIPLCNTQSFWLLYFIRNGVIEFQYDIKTRQWCFEYNVSCLLVILFFKTMQLSIEILIITVHVTPNY